MKDTASKSPGAGGRRRGYRGLSAEELRKQRYQRLIAAGTELFGERGYAATPIEAVCSHAKVSTRHFYEQFEGRESILHAVHAELVTHMEEIVRTSLTESRTPLTQRVADTIEAAVFFLLCAISFLIVLRAAARLRQVPPLQGVNGDFVRNTVPFDRVVVLCSRNEQEARFNIFKSSTKFSHIYQRPERSGA